MVVFGRLGDASDVVWRALTLREYLVDGCRCRQEVRGKRCTKDGRGRLGLKRCEACMVCSMESCSAREELMILL